MIILRDFEVALLHRERVVASFEIAECLGKMVRETMPKNALDYPC